MVAVSPLPGHQAIPDGWSAHHQPTAESTMTGTCTIYTGASGPAPFPADPMWAPDGTALTQEPIRCRVQALNDTRTNVQADQVQGVRQYLVTVPISQAPALTITDTGPVVVVHTGDDPGVAGLRLKVVDEQHGTLMFERDFVCTHNQTQD